MQHDKLKKTLTLTHREMVALGEEHLILDERIAIFALIAAKERANQIKQELVDTYMRADIDDYSRNIPATIALREDLAWTETMGYQLDEVVDVVLGSNPNVSLDTRVR